MKKIFLIAFSFLILTNAKAQDAQNTIKINPLSALLRIGSIFYERKLNENSSVTIRCSLYRLKNRRHQVQRFSLNARIQVLF